MKALRHLPLVLALGLAAGTVQAGLATPPATPPATTHVVTVGMAYLEKAIHVRDATPANPDVRLVAQAFRQRGAVIHTLAEEQLTRAALHALLEQVGKAMKPQDSLVFHFSGFSGPVGNAPVLYVQGTDKAADAVKDSSRQIPLVELRQWLAATGAPSLLVLLDTGPDAARQCGPWAQLGPIQSLTTVCADLPTVKPDQAGPFTTALAAGLQGAADANGDHQFSGDELATWLRAHLKGGATVYQTGPVARVLKASPDQAAALPKAEQQARQLDPGIGTVP